MIPGFWKKVRTLFVSRYVLILVDLIELTLELSVSNNY